MNKIKTELLGALLGSIVFMITINVSYYFYPNLKTLTTIEKFLIYLSYFSSIETWQYVVNKSNRK